MHGTVITAEKGTCPSGLSAICSYTRPSQEDSSEEEVRQESEAVRKANEEFLAQKKAHKLRGHRKRAERRHKSEGHKKRERAGSAGSAAGLAFRSPSRDQEEEIDQEAPALWLVCVAEGSQQEGPCGQWQWAIGQQARVGHSRLFGPGCAKGSDRDRGNCGD